MANRNKNIFAYLDSDDEDTTPKVTKKQEAASPSAPVALNKPAAGNKKGKKPFVEGADKKERTPRENREGGRPARGGRGGRGGREGRGPRREFERRSGTGRGKETSKSGGGARNWGNEADKSEQVAEAQVQEGDKVSGDEETPAEEQVVEEEEEVQLSYEEYIAQTKAKRSGELFAEVEVRQVTEDFSGAVQLTKDGKTPDFMESQYEKVFSKKTSGRKKQLITDLGFQSAQPERSFRERDSAPRGGRGGRGGREGRGRGDAPRGGRGGRGRGANAPNVGDMSAFPSLG